MIVNSIARLFCISLLVSSQSAFAISGCENDYVLSVFDVRNSTLSINIDVAVLGPHSLDLALEPQESGTSFSIENATPIPSSGVDLHGYFSGTTLTLPCLYAESQGVFEVSFQLQEAPALRLLLAEVTPVTGAVASNETPVSSVQVFIASPLLEVGASTSAYAIPMSEDDRVVLGKTTQWSASAEGKVNVSMDGLVTGIQASRISLLATVDGVTGEAPASIYEQDFVTRVGKQFMLNGEPFYVAGMNSQQALAFLDNGIQDSAIAHAVDYGINVLRIWASSEIGSVNDDSVPTVGQSIQFSDPNVINRPYYQYWDTATQSVAYNETASGLQFLDRLIALAGENDIRIIFNLLDNWEWWWGGVNQYVIWHGGTSHGDFFTNEEIKQTYKNWLTYLLNRENSVTGVRYKDDPTIMTWDLLNEAGCYHDGSGVQVLTFNDDSNSGCSFETVEPWVEEMAAFIKTIDSKHLISVGAQGHFTDQNHPAMGHVYSAYNEPDMRKILANPNIDVAAYHMYPYEDSGTGGDGSLTPFEWGVRFIEDRLALSDELNKPVILEEFGATNFDFHEELMNGWISILYDHGKAAFTFYDLGAYWGPGTFAAGTEVFGTNGWNMFPDSSSAPTLKSWIDKYLQ